MRGGLEESGSMLSAEEDDGKTYFFQKAYNTELARYEDPCAEALRGFLDSEVKVKEDKSIDHCIICQMAAEQERKMAISLGEELDVSSGTSVTGLSP